MKGMNLIVEARFLEAEDLPFASEITLSRLLLPASRGLALPRQSHVERDPGPLSVSERGVLGAGGHSVAGGSGWALGLLPPLPAPQ